MERVETQAATSGKGDNMEVETITIVLRAEDMVSRYIPLIARRACSNVSRYQLTCGYFRNGAVKTEGSRFSSDRWGPDMSTDPCVFPKRGLNKPEDDRTLTTLDDMRGRHVRKRRGVKIMKGSCGRGDNDQLWQKAFIILFFLDRERKRCGEGGRDGGGNGRSTSGKGPN
jgi:hypothetical protein